MKIGFVGLGKMGASMVERIVCSGHQCVVFDEKDEHVDSVKGKGIVGVRGLAQLVSQLESPRSIWCMVPSGECTEKLLDQLTGLLVKGDTIVDGGNSYYKDSIRRSDELVEKGINFVDVGTSGGVWGLTRGYSLSIGSNTDVFHELEPIFETLAPGSEHNSLIEKTSGNLGAAEKGYLHCGPVGSGHFVKMVQNGIEYGLMQAYAEGFELLRNASTENCNSGRFQFDLMEIAQVWMKNSMISSWLLELTANALNEDVELNRFEGKVEDSGTGRWMLEAALETGTPATAIAAALMRRYRSRQDNSYAEKLMSALREQFGGHTEASDVGDIEK